MTALRKGEEQLRLASRIPEENPNPIVRLGAEGNTIYRNPAALRIWQALPESARGPVQARLRAIAAAGLAAGERQDTEVEIGSRTYTVVVVPVPVERYVNLYLIDVTATHEANAERDAQQAFYETILDELSVELVVFDEQQRYVYANP